MGSVSLLHILGIDGEVARDGLIVSDGVVLAKCHFDIHCLLLTRQQNIFVLCIACLYVYCSWSYDTSVPAKVKSCPDVSEHVNL